MAGDFELMGNRSDWLIGGGGGSLATRRSFRFFTSCANELPLDNDADADAPPKYGEVRSRLWMFTRWSVERGGE